MTDSQARLRAAAATERWLYRQLITIARAPLTSTAADAISLSRLGLPPPDTS